MSTVLSPNMSLPVPVVSTEPGPAWANDINACMSILDQHSHIAGSGVQITPAAMNINADLTFGGFNATTVKSVRFQSQGSNLTSPSDIGCLYEKNADLYYNDGVGNVIRITQSGSVTGAAGTITGLPSGTASASYSGGTFTFQSATLTPATLATGPLVIGTSTSGSKTITLSPSVSQASNYNLTLPAAAPATNEMLVSDGSGNLSWSNNNQGRLPLGSVTATFPVLSGAYTTGATTAADSNGFVLCQGQTIVDATSPMNGVVVPNINNSVFLMGSTTSNTTGGSNSIVIAHTHTMDHGHANTFSLGGTVASGTHTHNMAHAHGAAYVGDNAGQIMRFNTSFSTGTTSASGGTQILRTPVYTTAGTSSPTTGITFNLIQFDPTIQNLYTTGALSAAGVLMNNTGTPSATASLTGAVTDFTGSTASGGTGSDSRPLYISAVYLMRIK